MATVGWAAGVWRRIPSDSTGTTYSFTATTGDNGDQYEAVFTNPVGHGHHHGGHTHGHECPQPRGLDQLVRVRRHRFDLQRRDRWLDSAQRDLHG
ncbi:MAG: hypothetical protein ABSF33_03150 [Acidimicrobiales bacterium]|jgi:hypothetical protein